MKKVLTIALALVMISSVAVFAAAEEVATPASGSVQQVKNDFSTVVSELIEAVGAEKAKAAIEETLAELNVPVDADAGELKEGTGDEFAASVISKLNLSGTDTATKIQQSASNDFVAFIAGLYTGKPPVTTVVKPEETKTTEVKDATTVKTGEGSSTIALAAVAALAVAGAAAFVCLKKKED